jgi:hypothetical protein
VPAWFAEVVIIAQHLATTGLLDAFAQQVHLVRGRFGSYEPIDFLALLIGYAISGERTLAAFFERVEPFETAKMRALWTPWSSSSLQPEPLSRRRGSSLREKRSVRSSSGIVSQRDGPRRPSAESSIGKADATLSLTSMRPVKPHANAPCPAIRRGHQHGAAWMRSVPPATAGDSLGKWFARALRRCNCTPGTGSARMQARAMASIKVN